MFRFCCIEQIGLRSSNLAAQGVVGHTYSPSSLLGFPRKRNEGEETGRTGREKTGTLAWGEEFDFEVLDARMKKKKFPVKLVADAAARLEVAQGLTLTPGHSLSASLPPTLPASLWLPFFAQTPTVTIRKEKKCTSHQALTCKTTPAKETLQ